MTKFTNSSYRWIIAGSLLPLHLALGLNMVGPSSLFPLIMDHYSLSRGTVSLLVASVGLAITIFLIPGGIISAKLGPKNATAIAGVLSSAGILAILLPPFWILVTLRISFGLGAAILLPTTSAIILQWFPPHERPFMNGVALAGQGLGVATSMFISAPIAESLGWQTSLFLYGVFTLLGTLVWFLLAQNSTVNEDTSTPPPMVEVLRVLRNKNVLMLSLATIGPFGLFMGYNYWLPSYYHEALAMSLEQAGSLAAILPLGVGVLNLLSGIILSWLGLRKPIFILSGILMPLLASGTFLFDNLTIITISLVLLGLIFSLFAISLFTTIMELPGISLEKVAVATAAALTFGNLAATLSPIFLGAATDILGSYKPGLFIVAFGSLTVFIAAAFLPETGPKGTPLPQSSLVKRGS